jgi:integrase
MAKQEVRVCRVLTNVVPPSSAAPILILPRTAHVEAPRVGPGRDATRKASERIVRRASFMRPTRLINSESAESVLSRARELQPTLTALQAARIQLKTRRQYLNAVSALLTWLCLRVLPQWSREVWDEVLSMRLEALWDAGAPKAVAQRTISGLLWIDPRLRGVQKLVLPSTSSALTGWARQEPGASRPPLPYVVMQAIVVHLVQSGCPWHGLAIAVLFESYLRSSELLTLQPFQIVPPPDPRSKVYQHVAILAAAEETGTTSKTGIKDVSVLMDLPRQRAVGAILLRYALRRVTPKGSLVSMWDFDYAQLRTALMKTIAELGVDNLGITLHSCRHGGASHDRATNSRSLRDIQARGFWKQSSSVQRYEKHARLGLQISAIRLASRPRVYQLAQRYDADLEQLFEPHFARLNMAASSSKSSRVLGTFPKP